MDSDTKAFVKSSTLVNSDWHKTPEGENFFRKFFSSSSTGRKLYGVLERPAVFDGIEEVTYKILFIGKTGAGKSWAVSQLAGLPNSQAVCDTFGIEVTDVYWPVKIWDKVILFKLQCWDAGDSSLKKYNHIMEACQDKVDMKAFVFSYADAATFSELPGYINTFCSKDLAQAASIVIGTRHSSNGGNQVTAREVEAFKSTYGIDVQSLNQQLASPHSPQLSGEKTLENMQDLFNVMNSVCEILWIRDQQYILNSSITV
ncbi:Miro-like protein [Nesidiocoris tenuis]|uniref:Ciliogenesis and planar polarity effector 2 n=1 Tax=Nesidiocoris tenuis TaxID=355587 RepID=A0ABN7ACU3_9HEMI|nr:Miro-like protein [Nesidiocoris tenuis]